MVQSGGGVVSSKMDFLGAVILSLLFVSGSSDSCTSDSDPCKAKCSGSSFDLSGLVKDRYISDNGYVYSFACGDGSSCGSKPNSVVCQSKQDGSGREWSLGVATSTQWTLISKNPIHLQLVFSNGDEENNKIRSSIISVMINKTSQAFVFVGEDMNTARYEFALSTTAGKLYGSSHEATISPGIIGWAIIAMALLVTCAYFIVGAIVMFKVKGARGLEIIPQYAFWKDFPFLLVDGFFLTISLCYRRSKYQRI